MAEYYLISQLPSLDGIAENMPLPITKERFLELTESNLDEVTIKELKNLSIKPSRDLVNSPSSLINAWNEGERALRLILGSVRAEKLKISFDEDNAKNSLLANKLIEIANIAAGMESPMEAERFLNDYRLEFLETLRPMDSFSKEYLFYYSLKLDLLSRIRKFDEEVGRDSYKNIYNLVMNAEKQEETL